MIAIEERITPEIITSLTSEQIFVFGANESGIHGAGAAKKALEWGAILGMGFGSRGQTFCYSNKRLDIINSPLGYHRVLC